MVSVDGATAMVDFFGQMRRVRLGPVEGEVRAGDHLVSHLGVALRRMAEEEVGPTLALYEELIRAAEREIQGGGESEETCRRTS